MARPWKDPKRGVYHLRQRTPSDLLEKLRGQSITLPVGDAMVPVTIGSVVQVSLRTKEPVVAKVRHAIADGALKGFWHCHRTGAELSKRNEGMLEGSQPRLTPSSSPAEPYTPSPTSPDKPALTVGELFERWATDRADKRAPNTIKRYRGSIRSFDAFLDGWDARNLTGDDVYAWAVHRRDVEGISATAINRNDLVAVSSLFRWASGRAGGQLVHNNPAAGISLDEPRIVAQRERTFREGEIAAILSAASAIIPDAGYPERSAARRWVPWLAAYTGARIGELMNLEKVDVRVEAGIPVIQLRVTKTGESRAVPIHAHLVEQGFLAFVEDAVAGPLFYDPKRREAKSIKSGGKPAETHPSEIQGRSLGRWIRRTVKLDPAVDPNHGWRHTWKTRALGAGIEERLRDAITGHSVGTVGRRYETPTLMMLADAMEQFPRYRT
ncbi:DUF6538 domain-containing protein [Methylobacterium komagatae]